MTTATQIQPQGGLLFVGGVPATVDLSQTLAPVHSSLGSGFSRIILNNRLDAAAAALLPSHLLLITARGSDDSIVFASPVSFFSANTITHEPINLA